MQLNSSVGLKSLTVSSALLFSSAVFSYNDFKDISNVNSVIVNPSTQDYIQETQDNAYADVILKSNFKEYLSKWEKNTQFYSFSNQIIRDSYFQKIVSMGEHIVPYIIDEIKNKPSTLVWALNIIYKKKISNNPRTTIDEACKLWVKKLS